MARAPQIKMSQLMHMTAAEIGRLSESELRGAYQSVKRTALSRVATFEKHGAEPPRMLTNLTKPAGELSLTEMRQAVRNAAYRYRESPHTVSYKDWSEKRETFRKKMQEALPDVDLSDQEKLDRFGRFMGDMQARYKSMWSAISEFVVDLYNDAVEIGEDPRQLMDNYDAWADEIKKADQRARDAGLKRGRGRSTSVKRFRTASGLKAEAERSRKRRGG